MHPLLVGGNFTTTSIYGLILYLEKWGIHYSMGGTGNIIKGFKN